MSDMILQQTKPWATRTEDDINLLNGTYTENPQQPKSASIKPHPALHQNHGHSVPENAGLDHVYHPS